MGTSPHPPTHVVTDLSLSPAGTLLDITADREDDTVYDLTTGKLLATLTDTTSGQFSRDGTLLIGGHNSHIIAWSTKDWSKVRDLPNDQVYVTTSAALPEKDLVVVGGPKVARLLHMSSGEEIAKLGTGYTRFAAFSADGSIIITYPNTGFAVWDSSGKQFCSRSLLGIGWSALSSNDRWLAAAPLQRGTSVLIWDFQRALEACGVPASARSQ